MKQAFILFLSLFLFGATNAQTVVPAKDEHAGHLHDNASTTVKTLEVLDVKETEFDFGTIPQGKPVYHSFQVFNKGALPLTLDNVQATCGCTTPEWSKEPIAPGASQTIKVGYNAAADGTFEKFVTITYNGNASKQIKIKGRVWKAPVSAAPANASVNFLKQQIQ
jgi:hypothetical protein